MVFGSVAPCWVGFAWMVSASVSLLLYTAPPSCPALPAGNARSSRELPCSLLRSTLSAVLPSRPQLQCTPCCFASTRLFSLFFSFFFSFIYISWRLITLQYCNGLCHTVIWISHGFTCVPHPEPTTLHCKTQLESWPLPQIAYLPFWSHALFPLLLLGVIPEYWIEE